MFDTILARGFEPRTIAVAARTIGGCYQACFYPDTRPLIGLAIFSVMPQDDGYRVAAEARSLREDELPSVLLAWLEERIPNAGAIVSWDHWRSLPARLTALATERHPRIREAATDTAGRWRDLPRSLTWHLRHARAASMPCLCLTGDPEPCRPRLPVELLPDPVVTEKSLITEAMRGWTTWASLFGGCDSADLPAQRALAAVRDWSNARTSAAG